MSNRNFMRMLLVGLVLMFAGKTYAEEIFEMNGTSETGNMPVILSTDSVVMSTTPVIHSTSPVEPPVRSESFTSVVPSTDSMSSVTPSTPTVVSTGSAISDVASPVLEEEDPDRDSGFRNCFDPKNRVHQKHPPICYWLIRRSHVRLLIYAPDGQLVRILRDGFRPAGSETIWWNRKDNYGDSLDPGVYTVLLEINGKKRTQKLPVIK